MDPRSITISRTNATSGEQFAQFALESPAQDFKFSLSFDFSLTQPNRLVLLQHWKTWIPCSGSTWTCIHASRVYSLLTVHPTVSAIPTEDVQGTHVLFSSLFFSKDDTIAIIHRPVLNTHVEYCLETFWYTTLTPISSDTCMSRNSLLMPCSARFTISSLSSN